MNISMIKGLLKAVKKGKTEKIILLISDITLSICMPVVIITGIMIAKELFIIQSGISWILLFNIHNILSYICLGTMLVHILFHAKYIAGVCKKLPSVVSGTEMKSAVTRVSLGALAAVVLYSSLAVFKNVSDKKDAVNIVNEEKTFAATEPVTDTTAAQTTPVFTEVTKTVLQEPEIQATQEIEESYDEEITTQPETTPIPSL